MSSAFTTSDSMDNGLASPPGLTRRPRAGTMPSSLHLGPPQTRPDALIRRLTGMPASLAASSFPASGESTPLELSPPHSHSLGTRPVVSQQSDIASSVFRSKPSSRIRSGSLVNLPSSGAGSAFGSSVYGSGWAPRSSHMSTQILEEIRSVESSAYGDEVRTLDYLGLDDATSGGQQTQNINQQPFAAVKTEQLSSFAASPLRIRSNTVAGIPRREASSHHHSGFALNDSDHVTEMEEEEDAAEHAPYGSAQAYSGLDDAHPSTYFASTTLGSTAQLSQHPSLAALMARPRASTIGILDDASPESHRRRAVPSSTTPNAASAYHSHSASGVVTPALADEARMGGHAYDHVISDMALLSTPDRSRESALDPSPPPQQPSRSLWLGNLDTSCTTHDILTIFTPYGPIESIRLLPDKECAFINFVSMEDCLRAKADVTTRLAHLLIPRHSGTVRVGFGKPESAPSVPSTPSNAYVAYRSAAVPTPGMGTLESQSAPTRALWVGSIPSAVTTGDLLRIFGPFGAIESARVLTHKNCGFINFERTEDALSARKALNSKPFLGNEVGPIKIGFAKAPSKTMGTPSTPGRSAMDNVLIPGSAIAAQMALNGARGAGYDIIGSPVDRYRNGFTSNGASPATGFGFSPSTAAAQALQAATNTPSGLSSSYLADPGLHASTVASAPMPHSAEFAKMVRELGGADDPDQESDAAFAAGERSSSTFYLTVASLDDAAARLRSNLDVNRTRELKKRLEPGVNQQEADTIAAEILEDAAPLSSDYIGNVIIQRLFERCSDASRVAMLERIGPFLPLIGGHKNGTWAAQKIIECASTPAEISIICASLRAFTPALLLGGFSNYVVQGVLRFGAPVTDFVYDAMVEHCWEIGQGRFGARSMRTCLDHPSTPKAQIKRVAVAVIVNAYALATNANGSLLLTWLLDTSSLPGRYTLLAPKLLPHLVQLSTNKLASTTVLRIINQKVDLSASHSFIDGLFEAPQVLEEVIADQLHGAALVQKVLVGAPVDEDKRRALGEKIRSAIVSLRLQHIPAYRRLVEDLAAMDLPIAGVEVTPPTHSAFSPITPSQLRPAFAYAETPNSSPGGPYGRRDMSWQSPNAVNPALLAQMSAMHLSPQRRTSPMPRHGNGSPYTGPGTPLSFGSHLSYSPGPGSPATGMYGSVPTEAYSSYDRSNGGGMPESRQQPLPTGYQWSG